jgi:hypothetical protein
MLVPFAEGQVETGTNFAEPHGLSAGETETKWSLTHGSPRLARDRQPPGVFAKLQQRAARGSPLLPTFAHVASSLSVTDSSRQERKARFASAGLEPADTLGTVFHTKLLPPINSAVAISQNTQGPNNSSTESRTICLTAARMPMSSAQTAAFLRFSL